MGAYMNVPGCTRVNLTRWQERSRIVVRAGCGQRERDKRQADVWARLRTKIAPGKFAAVQARELWSTSEEVHLRPGHHWVFELGDAGDDTCVEKTFKLANRTHEMYKGVRFDTGDQALVCVYLLLPSCYTLLPPAL